MQHSLIIFRLVNLQYCDLDEFLSDNSLPLESQPAVGGAMVPTQQAKLESTCLTQCAVPQPQTVPQTNGISIPKREPSPCPSEPLSPLGINPPSPADSSTYYGEPIRRANDSIHFDNFFFSISRSFVVRFVESRFRS